MASVSHPSGASSTRQPHEEQRRSCRRQQLKEPKRLLPSICHKQLTSAESMQNAQGTPLSRTAEQLNGVHTAAIVCGGLATVAGHVLTITRRVHRLAQVVRENWLLTAGTLDSGDVHRPPRLVKTPTRGAELGLDTRKDVPNATLARVSCTPVRICRHVVFNRHKQEQVAQHGHPHNARNESRW